MSGTGVEGIRPIAELFRGDCVALWATTFNIELSLFNEYLLRRLGDSPLNAVVLADQRRLDESLEAIPAERLDTLGAVNRRWLLRGVQVGSGRFHPKSYLAVRARTATLMVGSGNLSTDGIDAGREVFSSFTSGTPVGDTALATWRSWMRRLVGESGDTLLAERFADLEQRLPKPEGLTAVADSPVWHNLDAPLGPRFCDKVAAAADGPIDELIATAPFFDEEAVALGSLVQRLQPRLLRLYMTSTTSVAGAALRQRLREAGCAVELYAYEPDRFTHAKLIGAVAADRGWMLSGSANLSRAALTLPPGVANVELAVFAELGAEHLRGVFLPPGVHAIPLNLDELEKITYDADDTPAHTNKVRLQRATLVGEGRIRAQTEPAAEEGWQLADHQNRSALVLGMGAATTAEALVGPLVRIEDQAGETLSNWVVLEDPDALARTLAATQAGGSSRPVELTGAELDTPLGRALLYLHRNLVMDAAEIPTATAGGSSVVGDEVASSDTDNLWDRLERETLGRDPRAGTYGRLVAARARTDTLTDPLVELLDAMRERTPAGERLQSRAGGSVLARLVREHTERGERAHVRWSTSARIRVRTRNVLRRWASAQTDPRLAWVNPLAPLLNLQAVATVFADLYLRAIDDDQQSELDSADLDDLWVRWFAPIVGTGQRDGWLDRAGLSTAELAEYITDGFAEICSALCWLALRPGSSRRERIIRWQSPLAAALDRGLLVDTDDSAAYVSLIVGHEVSRDQLTTDFLEAIEFVDDRLWCEKTAHELALDTLDLETAASDNFAKVVVRGVADPLHDPRLARLVAAVRAYRRVDAVAVYAADLDWRIVIEPGQRAYFLPQLGADPFESAALSVEDLDQLVAAQRVLADLFPPTVKVA
ncbi:MULTISPECIES: hypothetical protein [unclassified Actinotalea]|uniref:hypothetical protein n=1 Tax=unclassified Actinotalea TaxID=2638618 RepID=UPI0015F69285|nr:MULTISPECIES: hypothetical protein [unclassified Actinotalea]